MGAKFTRQNRRPGGEDYRSMARQVQRIYIDEMVEAAENGVAEAKGFIKIAGTQKKWGGSFPDLKQGGKRRSAPSRGRIHTGEMLNAINYRVSQGATIGVEVGWIRNFQEYFGFQDEGFSAGGYREQVQDPVSAVEGMRLMAHMRAYMRDQTDIAIDRATRRILNGL